MDKFPYKIIVHEIETKIVDKSIYIYFDIENNIKEYRVKPKSQLSRSHLNPRFRNELYNLSYN
jgi:hypothetical protein